MFKLINRHLLVAILPRHKRAVVSDAVQKLTMHQNESKTVIKGKKINKKKVQSTITFYIEKKSFCVFPPNQ